MNERERDGKLHDLIALCFIIIFIKNEKASKKIVNYNKLLANYYHKGSNL